MRVSDGLSLETDPETEFSVGDWFGRALGMTGSCVK